MNQKITNNFSFYEFRPNGAPITWEPEYEYQAILIRTLAENLQIVRQNISGGITITSGVRSFSDYKRLLNSGYNPSKTSDHFFGLSIPLDINDKLYKSFGMYYSFSVGAADCIASDMSCDNLFKTAVSLCKNGKCRFGQIILEKDQKTGKEWVHFSNDPKTFFGYSIVSMLNRPPFLVTNDGGKTYQTIVTI